tara:strand:- start:1009 stop:1599 length:591 start_codon:yes stop_codon:yes gene_type:complete
MGWSDKYKKSINCNNPKGFSQKAHCAGKKKRENIMKISDLKNEIRTIVNERSINKIAKEQQKNAEDIEKALDFYKKNKNTDKAKAFIKVLKKLGDKKKALAKEMDIAVSSKLRNVGYAGPLESVNEMDPYLKPTPKDDEEVDESINEGASTEEKRIAMLAVRKQAKYRNVDTATAIQDQIRALEDLKRDLKKGKIK